MLLRTDEGTRYPVGPSTGRSGDRRGHPLCVVVSEYLLRPVLYVPSCFSLGQCGCYSRVGWMVVPDGRLDPVLRPKTLSSVYPAHAGTGLRSTFW